MKKGFVSLLVIISVFFNCAFAKEFSDVKNTKYKNSVDVLSELGVVSGYNDDTYKPDNIVTRAEMSKLVVTALGRSATATSLSGTTQYNDVPSSHWASGYVNAATNIGIVKGYPDGSFKPNDTVSYAEASTMLLRALNYTKELEDEKYPSGYMSKANDAGIIKNVVATSSADGATRGNIAIMVYNTLMANVRTIISTTSKGIVNYGDGAPLIEQKFDDYVLIKGGTITDINFEKSNITIKDYTNNRKITAKVESKDDLFELYYREVDLLYNEKKDEFLSFEIIDDYDVEEIEVEKVKDDSIYNSKGKEFEIPKNNIMAYINNYDEVETAYATYDGSDMLAMILTGEPKVYAGIVTEKGITVKNRKGFEYKDVDGKVDELALSNTGDKLSNNDFILYSFDNEGYAIIQANIERDDGLAIEEIKDTSIKLKKEEKIELKSGVEYYVYLVDTDNDISKGKLSNIDQEFDLAYVEEIAGVYYIVVFEDSVDDDDIVSKLSVSEAKDELESILKSANKLLKKESSYSVSTFVPLKEAIENAEKILKNSASAAKLELAARKIEDAIDNLETAKSDDKNLRKTYTQLEDLIKEAESYKESDYTAASYKNLVDELKKAKAVKITSTTIEKIEERISALKKAINLLVTISANNELQGATTKLKDLLTKGAAVVKAKADYTETTYKKFETVYEKAKKLNIDEASLSEINTQITNMEVALEDLEAIAFGEYKKMRTKLDDTYNDAKSRKRGNYTKESFEEFDSKFEDLAKKYGALKSTEEVAKLANKDIEAETTILNSLNNSIKEALKVLVSVVDDNLRTNLKTYIEKGKTYTASTWNRTSITYTNFKKILDEAEKIANDNSSTQAEISAALVELMQYIS